MKKTITITVQLGNEPVTGLTIADFEILPLTCHVLTEIEPGVYSLENNDDSDTHDREN